MKKNHHPQPRPTAARSGQAISARDAARSEIKALKIFSQNFLKDESVLEKMKTVLIENLSQTSQSQVALEVGPGMGALTRRICSLDRLARVVAIEKDPRAVLYLKQHLVTDHAHLQVIESDILKFDPSSIELKQEGSNICVGNLPYAISSEFLLWFCANKQFFQSGHFLLQKEVVARVNAQTGTKAYGRLSAFLQLHFDSVVHFDVLPQAFDPQPKVTSAFFSLFPKSFQFENTQFANTFERTTAWLFSSRRKMLRKTLEHLFSSQNIPYADFESIVMELLKRHGVALDDRPENLSPQCLFEIAQVLWKGTH